MYSQPEMIGILEGSGGLEDGTKRYGFKTRYVPFFS